MLGVVGLKVNVNVEFPTWMVTVFPAAAGTPTVTPCTLAEPMIDVQFHEAVVLVTALFARSIAFAVRKDPKTACAVAA